MHNRLVLTNLMDKYDKKCHLYVNAASFPKASQVKQDRSGSIVENRDEFLAVVVGQLIRLYAKSKSMSRGFQSWEILNKIKQLMYHEQYII